jgi:hypothetical protein
MPERPLANVDPPQDGSPSWDEVEQREGLPELPVPAVPVHIDGPVQIQQLPPRTSRMATIVAPGIGIDQPTELLSKDLRRSRTLVMALDENVVIGLTKQDTRMAIGGVASGLMLPKNVWLDLRGSSAAYVASQTANPSKVLVLAESWAD